VSIARLEQIAALGTITMEAGWVNVPGDLGDLFDELVKAGWTPPEKIHWEAREAQTMTRARRREFEQQARELANRLREGQ